MKRFNAYVRRLGITFCLVLMMCLSALAEDETAATVDISGVTNALTTGLTGLVPTILTAVGALAAVGLGIFAAKFAVRIGLQMFKTVTNK